MAKLKLTANPTFKAKVPIGIPGGEPVSVEMTFRGRTRKEYDEWVAEARQRTKDRGDDTPATADEDIAAFLNVVVGWELEEEFNKDNVGLLLQNHFDAGTSVMRVYAQELWNQKLKN